MKIACFFNTTELGGAERSMINQLLVMSKNHNITCFIPKLGGRDLEKEVLDNGLDVRYYYYPKIFYKLSRKQKSFPIKLILGFLNLICSLFIYRFPFKDYDTFYFNGNKAAFYGLFHCCIKKNYNQKVYWHLRDYLDQGLLIKIFKFFLKKMSSVTIIGNSIDVTKKTNKSLSLTNLNYKTIYNLSGIDFKVSTEEKPNRVSVVSMLTPWKGIHWVITYAKLFEEDLIQLGVEEFAIYGKQIYKTHGPHLFYKEQIHQLAKESQLIKFYENEKPETIFSKTKVLIHSSIEPEPFGRVILEAQKTRTVVISTGLGGSSEIVQDGKTGFIIKPYDYYQLHSQIRKIFLDQTKIRSILNEASTYSDNFEREVMKNIEVFFNAEARSIQS